MTPESTMKPRLLMLTPVWPDDKGVGIQRRAAALLGGLAARFAVDLRVVPVFGATEADLPTGADTARVLDAEAVQDTLVRLAERIGDPAARTQMLDRTPLPRLARFSTPAAADAIAAGLEAPPDAVLINRLYLAPLWPLLKRRIGRPARVVLDLDDDEPLTQRRLADLSERLGDPAGAAALRKEADKYEALSGSLFAGFDAVGVCSEQDRARLGAAHPDARFELLPNTYGPARSARDRRAAGPLRLLFVGALDYLPNIDAALYLCLRLLPQLRASLGDQVELTIAGRDPAPAVAQACPEAAATLVANAEALEPLYDAADIALVPLRAGGGTRIKILEAFATRVPVISTPIGAEGLDLDHERHLLLADLDGFAEACLRLHADPGLGRALAEAGAERLTQAHGPEALARGLDALFA
jgi:glycosyltransferase involved in cell wall biosynthesis